MDVGELLGFKPELGLKPIVESSAIKSKDRQSSSRNPKKRSRLEAAPRSNKTTNYSAPAHKEINQNNQHISSNINLQLSTHKFELNSDLSNEQEKLIEEKLGQLEQQDNEEQNMEETFEGFQDSGKSPMGRVCSETECNNGLEEFDKHEKCVIHRLCISNSSLSYSGPLDEARLKKIVHNFEKKVLKNQELRIKFPDDPKKFMESEIELNESIEEMHVVATAPELYSILIELGVIKTVLALFSHENTDVSIAVVDLMQEMTDLEDVDDIDGVEDFIDSLMDSQIIATLVHNLQRLDESVRQESEGVHNTLGIIENLAELRPEICSEAGPLGLLQWLLKRLKAKIPFDGNKLYASEILAICVQNNSENQRLLGSMEGIDVILQQLAQYKRHDPHSSEEQEMMENLFDSLCSCLLLPVNREPFLQGEGLQLMNLMLREKKLSRNGALRVLDHALSGTEGADNCNKFIDILGLRTIFPLFMKTPKKHGTKGLSKEQHEEHLVSIIHWLLRHAKSNQRQRLLNKFTENDHEKVDRLLELHFKYLERVLATNTALEEQARAENLDEDAMYLRRLDGGLFTLQLVDYIMLDICASGPPSIKRRVLKILNVRNASIKTIKNIIREYASNLGEENEDKSEEQESILELLDKFQNT